MLRSGRRSRSHLSQACGSGSSRRSGTRRSGLVQILLPPLNDRARRPGRRSQRLARPGRPRGRARSSATAVAFAFASNNEVTSVLSILSSRAHGALAVATAQDRAAKSRITGQPVQHSALQHGGAGMWWDACGALGSLSGAWASCALPS